MVAKAQPAELAIDLSRVTAREMAAFFKAAQTNDVVTLAGVFTKLVTACPWGDPGSADTFLELPFFGEFQDVVKAISEAGKNAGAR